MIKCKNLFLVLGYIISCGLDLFFGRDLFNFVLEGSVGVSEGAFYGSMSEEVRRGEGYEGMGLGWEVRVRVDE